MSRRKVFLVGDGRVGSTFANDLLQNVRIDELVICDVVKKITEGDALDLEDLAPFVGQCTVKSGDYSDAKDADIAVITAGAARKTGMTRLDLVKTNVKILESIIIGFSWFFPPQFSIFTGIFSFLKVSVLSLKFFAPSASSITRTFTPLFLALINSLIKFLSVK